MKNKKLTYSLLVIVLGVWGFFFFTLFSDNSAVEFEVESNYYEVKSDKDSINFKDLSLNYSDPFLQRKIVAVSNTNVASKSSKPKSFKIPTPKKIVKRIIWPKIEYGGTVNITKGLVKINSRLFILQENEVANEVTVTKLYNDSLQVKFREETKTVVKNNN